jgi:hypothetical protein
MEEGRREGELHEKWTIYLRKIIQNYPVMTL